MNSQYEDYLGESKYFGGRAWQFWDLGDTHLVLIPKEKAFRIESSVTSQDGNVGW